MAGSSQQHLSVCKGTCAPGMVSARDSPFGDKKSVGRFAEEEMLKACAWLCTRLRVHASARQVDREFNGKLGDWL